MKWLVCAWALLFCFVICMIVHIGLGNPAHISTMGHQPKTLTWKGEGTAVFTDQDGLQSFVAVADRPPLTVGKKYAMQITYFPFGKFRGASFWLKPE